MPDSVKKARGTDQPCRMSGDEVFELVSQDCKAPAYLDKEAKKIFKALSERLIMQRLLSPLDLEQLAIYSLNYSRILKAEKMIREEGEVVLIKDEDGNLLRQEENVWLKVQKDAMKMTNMIGTQFGFSPLSRVKLASLVKSDGAQKDDFSDFEEV